MFKEDYEFIERSDVSSNDKEIFRNFLEVANKHDPNIILNYTKEELKHIFAIAKSNPSLQIKMWLLLPDDIANNPENAEIFEDVLDNKFGEYIKGIDKRSLVKILNNSRSAPIVIDNKGNILYMNVALLGQLNSSIFENSIAREAFSFEQLLEIVSFKNTEIFLKSMLENPNSKELLINIGKNSQNWQAYFQYLMELNYEDREHIINEFGSDGRSLIQKEQKSREEHFDAMEKGYFEDEESGEVFDCEINPVPILLATFGISYGDALELIKKYGIDSEKLDIHTEDDKKIYRKLQIIKELTTPMKFESYEEEYEYYRHYYYSHREELLALSKEDVSLFWKVNLEKSFLDLYARQYDRALGVQADKIQDVSYNGRSIPVYEVSGDFMILIRGEQNVSPENKNNFWNTKGVQLKGLCQSTIGQDYVRPVNYAEDDICYIGKVSCGDGELRMASTTNIKSQGANIALSNLGIKSDYGNGVVFRIPAEQINNSRGINNETITSRSVYNSETGIYERQSPDYIIYIQDTNDIDITQDKRFMTAQFAASQTGIPILIIPREKCAQREQAKIQKLKDKLINYKERSVGETDESIIEDLIVKFNNNREGILTSPALKEKYFTESEHIELVGTINERLSQLAVTNPQKYKSLVQTVSKVYQDEIAKYYAFSYDRSDAQKELDIDLTREHLKPYEDFLIEHERNLFDLSADEKDNVFSTIRNISATSYYDMNIYHSLSHIQKVIMFSGILAKNENLNKEETEILLASAAFHDSGRDGKEEKNDNHALASARQVKKYFEDNPTNPFNITAENISMIQAIIEYHEHMELDKGVVDRTQLLFLSNKYDIDPEKIDSLVRISGLLKDADALDRARFGKKNENRSSLDARYLRSDTAKSISMLRFSEECNFTFRERESQTSERPSVDVAEEILESELEEFNRPKIQMSSLKQVVSNITAVQKKKVMGILKSMQAKLKKTIEDISR